MKKITQPKIVLDARMISEIPHGIARYVMNLTQGLSLKHQSSPLPYQLILLTRKPTPTTLKQISNIQILETKIPFLHPLEIFEIPFLLYKIKAHLYHSTSFSSLAYCPCPSLITIHDLNHITYGNFLKKAYYHFLLKRFTFKCETIVTVSNFSKQAIADWLSIPPHCIQIVYNAVDQPERPTDEHLNSWGLNPYQYFVCLSNMKPHKNLRLLLKAHTHYYQQATNPYPLVICLLPHELHGFAPLTGLRALGPLNDSQLHTLLTYACGGLFPSLYEGFGLAPLEAALQGTPLAVSDIPAHQEGLQDLKPAEVIWVKPQDLNGWILAFEKMSHPPTHSVSLESQKTILDRFSITKMTQSMDQIYQNMLKINSCNTL